MVPAAEIAAAIRERTLVLEREIGGGERLALLRLSAKWLDREEVFMGSILFGDWLRKSFVRVVEERGLGQILPITNDLETGYFLLVTRATQPELAAALRGYVDAHLGDLFMGDADPELGIHGSFEAMFSIPKSDFEPFPIFAIPNFLLPELERRVRMVLRELIRKPMIRVRRGQNPQPAGTSIPPA